MIPLVKRDDTLDPAYFALRPKKSEGGGEDLTEILRRLLHLEECCEEVQPQLHDLTQAITVLNGDTTIDGSVKKTVTNEINKVIDNAPETFDTLKEVADWIEENTATITNIINIIDSIEKPEAISKPEIDRIFNF